MRVSVGYASYIRTEDQWETKPLAWCLTEGTEATARAVATLRTASDPAIRRRIKKHLPGITASVTLAGARGKDTVTAHTGLLQLDIDGKANTAFAGHWPQLRDLLGALPFVAYAALSSSGAGVWALARIGQPPAETAGDIAAVEAWHRRRYFAVEHELRERYGITADPARKDLLGARYLAYDPDARINYDAEALPPGLLRDDPKAQRAKAAAASRARRPRHNLAQAGDSPIARYKAANDTLDLLRGYGWTAGREGVNDKGERVCEVRRPGDTDNAKSGQYNYATGKVWAFSTSTPLPIETPLDAFDVYAYYEHGGDKTAGGQAIAKLAGYEPRVTAERERVPRAPTPTPEPTAQPGLKPEDPTPPPPAPPPPTAHTWQPLAGEAPTEVAPPDAPAEGIRGDAPDDDLALATVKRDGGEWPAGYDEHFGIASENARRLVALCQEIGVRHDPHTLQGYGDLIESGAVLRALIAANPVPEVVAFGSEVHADNERPEPSTPEPATAKPPLPPYFAELIASLRSRGLVAKADAQLAYCREYWAVPPDLAADA